MEGQIHKIIINNRQLWCLQSFIKTYDICAQDISHKVTSLRIQLETFQTEGSSRALKSQEKTLSG